MKEAKFGLVSYPIIGKDYYFEGIFNQAEFCQTAGLDFFLALCYKLFVHCKL